MGPNTGTTKEVRHRGHIPPLCAHSALARLNRAENLMCSIMKGKAPRAEHYTEYKEYSYKWGKK